MSIERLIRLPEVRSRTGLGRSTIYRRMDQGTFPKKVDLGGGIVAWRESELARWVEDPSSYGQQQ